eukprot:TRINITY_DN37166_c0_g1_i1.p1 TRINITY_DN37166_c0_g1~~TRINITY_DN37166_c0_g1_i1.p1  ORF type:complete len:771 (+),score=176.52 TRINITY_DN37166_c0_g1_i1:119-2431(+)
MAARLLHVRQACQLEPDDRTEEHITDIVESVKDVKFFSRLSTLQQRSLCRHMTLEKFQAEETVFSLGDRGEELYIILSGSVRVQVQSQTTPCPAGIHADKCDCPGRPLETAVYLERGTGFGELSLQSDVPRSASIVAAENTELLVVTRTNYEKYAGQLHRQFIEQRVRFLRQCPRIEEALQRCLVSPQDVAAMANCLNESQLSGSEIVVRQGEPVEHMIFVRSGKLAMVRAVDPDKAREERAQQAAQRGGTTRTRRSIVAGREDERRQTVGRIDPIVPQEQTQQQLACNLAKAMLAMKKEDRDQRANALMKDINKGKEETKSVTIADSRPSVEESPGDAAAASSGAAEAEARSGVGKAMWGKLKSGFKQAQVIKGLSGTSAPAEEQSDKDEVKKTDAMAHLNQFTEVQAARRVYTDMQTKALREKRKSMLVNTRGATKHKQLAAAAAVTTRTVLLRIGTISPFQYFGDQQIGNNQVYPVSLVSDPVAEIYMMTKHDILRRLPRKMLAALFEPEGDCVPSDVQLTDMHRQTLRWEAFRKSLHGDSLGSQRRQASLNAAANYEFLGMSAKEEEEKHANITSRRVYAALTLKDQENFSQTSARFLRRFDAMRADPRLRRALAKAGLDRRKDLSDCLVDNPSEESDPMKFHFEMHWSKLRKDPISLDTTLDTERDMEGVPFAAADSTGGRSSLQMAGAQVASPTGSMAMGQTFSEARNENRHELPRLVSGGSAEVPGESMPAGREDSASSVSHQQHGGLTKRKTVGFSLNSNSP